jgi:hypothetical protein
MRLSRLVLPAALVAAIGAAAYAERPAVHIAEYRLPDGGVARVRYTGDVPPRLVMVPAAEASPFAMVDRIAAMMDAEMEAMMAPVAAGGADAVALAAQPAGAHWTSVSRTVSGSKVCTTEVSMVSAGEGKAPRVTRRTAGDCAAAPASLTPPAPPAVPTAHTVPHDSI